MEETEKKLNMHIGMRVLTTHFDDLIINNIRCVYGVVRVWVRQSSKRFEWSAARAPATCLETKKQCRVKHEKTERLESTGESTYFCCV